MNSVIKEKSEIYINETIEKIQEIVRIDSVRDLNNANENAICGIGVGKALDSYLAMAQEIGMRIYRDNEGLYGYAEIGPEDSELVGILGHVDVVPIGDESKWTEAKPFSGDIVDDKIIGRGTLDDKGPMIINLMAIKLLVEQGYEFKKRLRLIVGCAEETTWQCMEKYVKTEELPVIGYSPDANFPLIHAEKSILRFDGANNKTNYDFKVYYDGAYNAVAESAFYEGFRAEELFNELKKLNFDARIEGNKVEVLGKSAHSMACFLGINAINRLAIAMYNIGINTNVTDFLACSIKETFHGELIFNEILNDNVSGNLTFNIGNIFVDNTGEKVGIDIRVPVLFDEMEILEKVKEKLLEYQLELVVGKVTPKLYLEKDSELVVKLLNIYTDVTKEDVQPLTSGGGTYARAIKNCCAFGMVFTDDGMINKMHQPNECLQIKYIRPALEIYARAIYELTK